MDWYSRFPNEFKIIEENNDFIKGFVCEEKNVASVFEAHSTSFVFW